MSERLYRRLVEMWYPHSPYPDAPDVIVAIGYATIHDALTLATSIGLKTALRKAKDTYPLALVAFANSSHTFPGSERFESAEKELIRRKLEFPMKRVINAGAITNSVSEAEMIKAALDVRGIRSREIALVTEGATVHDRSLLFIWGKVFKGVRISVLHSSAPAYQPMHPFFLQQGKWRWLLANMLRQAVLRLPFGLRIARMVRHHGRG